MAPKRMIWSGFVIVSALTLTFCGSDPVSTTHMVSTESSLAEPSDELNDSMLFVSVKPKSEKKERFFSLSQVQRRLSKRPSRFVVNTLRDTIVKCKNGTLLAIPAGAFVRAKDHASVTSEVKISVQEFYEISDMVEHGLTTASNGKLLETGGMINIKVVTTTGADSCMLKPGRNLTIAMPNGSGEPKPGMMLFNGVHHESEVNWLARRGIAGMAQSWRGNGVLPGEYAPLDSGFIFLEQPPKKKPEIIRQDGDALQTEISLPVRDLVRETGVVTVKAQGYIDDEGGLICYRIGDLARSVSFKSIFSITSVGSLNVHVPVEVYLSYKSPLDPMYYLKLFKMKKGDPDSLVTVTIKLNPLFKTTSVHKLNSTYRKVLTVSEFRTMVRQHQSKVREYERRKEQLRLNELNNISSTEINPAKKMQAAQNYFLLSTPKLGWINCDRFYDVKEKVDYLVKLEQKARLLMVFNSIRSVLSPDIDGVFRNVPPDQKVTIIGLRTEQGKLLLAMQEAITSDKPLESLAFKPVSIEEYKTSLQRLNNL